MVKINKIIVFTVFICGATLMSLEILAGRALSPNYGNTIFVWGSIIGTFLMSLGFGYYFGGKLADKRPNKRVLSYLLIITAILVFIIPYITKPLLRLIDTLPNSIAPLIAVMIIYFLPSLLHGFVSPFAIKVSTKNLAEIGRMSGKLYAWATIGSVFGTFITTFVLIIFLPINTIYYFLGIILLLTAFLLSARNYLIIVIIIIIFIGTCFIPNQSASEKNKISAEEKVDIIVTTIESPYGQVKVRDFNGVRSLYIDGGAMMQVNLEDESQLVQGWQYVGCMEFPFMQKSDIKDVLSMGLGAGLHQRMAHDKYDIRLDAVELNKSIVDVAEKYFQVQQTDTFKIWINDARVFLNDSSNKYDLIVIDVFQYSPSEGYKIPFHLTTQEFFKLVENHLNPGGILAMNFAADSKDIFFRSEYETINSVFKNIYSFNCGTQVIFASNEKYIFSELREEDIKWGFYYLPELKGDEKIFTDNYAPVN